MNRYWSDDDDDNDDYDDYDDYNDYDEGRRQYGLTTVSLEEPALIQIVETVVQNDYCWDIYCYIRTLV